MFSWFNKKNPTTVALPDDAPRTPAKQQFEIFLSDFGSMMPSLGYHDKLIRKTYFFQKEMPDGYVGLHLNRRYRAGLEVNIYPRVAVSLRCVQEILVKTELYIPDSRGLTWSFGIDLMRLRDEGKRIPPTRFRKLRDGSWQCDISHLYEIQEKYGKDNFEVPESARADEVKRLAEDAFELFRTYGEPFLMRYGSEEGALDLTLRTDDVAELCFLDPRKPLTGLILARKLDRPHAKELLLANARKRYAYFASNGNPRISEQFERMARDLDLI